MAERIQAKDFQIDPVKMSLVEGGWINALDRKDGGDFLKYIAEGLTHQYHLNRNSADEAADYLLAFLVAQDLKDKEENLHSYHKVLSQGSGLGFDAGLATKTYFETEKSGSVTVEDLCKYHRVIYGGLISWEDLWPIMNLRRNVMERYRSVKDNEKSTRSEHHKAWSDLTAGLLDFYTELNDALASSSRRLVG